MAKSWKDASRTAWSTTGGNDSGSDISNELLQIGCLQRIADATELMAKNHAALIEERDRYERWFRSEQAQNATLRRRVNALRGVIAHSKRGRRNAK